MSRPRILQLTFLSLAAAALASAGLFQGPIDQRRVEMDQFSGEDITQDYP